MANYVFLVMTYVGVVMLIFTIIAMINLSLLFAITLPLSLYLIIATIKWVIDD